MTKIKYYQENDRESINKDKAFFTKFGYKVTKPEKLDGRDAVQVTYTRKDTKETEKLAKLESRYEDAMNAVEFAEAYEKVNPNKTLSSHLSGGQITLFLIGILFFGLFLVVAGGLGVCMIYFPETAEEFAANMALTDTVTGEKYALTRDLNISLNGALDFIGIEAFTWDFVGYFLIGTGVVMLVAITLVVFMTVKAKISRINYNKAECARYEEKLAISRSAAFAAKDAMKAIDKELSALKAE